MRQYKIKYFERFAVQKEYFSANLPEYFFKEWYDKLSDSSLKNWQIHSSSCIRLLVEHKDAPEWLRDKYINDPRHEKRGTALLTNSGPYKYKHIDKILSDKSSTVRWIFFNSVIYDLHNGITIDPDCLTKILTIPSKVPSLRSKLRLTFIEQSASLVHPDPTIRTFGKILHNATEEQKQLLLAAVSPK